MLKAFRPEASPVQRRITLCRRPRVGVAKKFQDCHPERSRPIRLRIGLRSRGTLRFREGEELWQSLPLHLYRLAKLEG